MTDQALRDELMTLLVAGQETSAILLGWACALLAHHPAQQAAVAAEVAAVLGGAPPGAADIGRLPQLEAVIFEALRLWSPAYMVGRCAARGVALRSGGGATYHLPAGTTLLVRWVGRADGRGEGGWGLSSTVRDVTEVEGGVVCLWIWRGRGQGHPAHSPPPRRVIGLALLLWT
jgi:hypothetical protein